MVDSKALASADMAPRCGGAVQVHAILVNNFTHSHHQTSTQDLRAMSIAPSHQNIGGH